MSTMQVKVDGVDYATFAEALNNVQDGSVVELLADVVNETVQDYNLTVKLTINGNGFKMENVHLNPQADLVLDKIAFAGDSTVNASNANCKSLTITNCTADVTPAKEGFHPTFVNLGTSEYNVGLSLTMTGNTILVDNDADGYGKAVFGWRHLDNVTISNNTFGSEAEPLEKIAVKLMNFNEGAEVVIENNTIYGSDAEREFLAIDLYQNNSRANNYTAEIGGNTVVNVNKKAGNGFSFALVECNNFNAGMYGNGSVQIMADNTMNGKAVTMDDVKRDSSSPDGDYDYIGVNVTKDENGKITGGTFRVGEQGKSEFEDALASGVIAGEANADGLYELVQVDLSTIYVDSSLAGKNYGDEIAEGKIFGINAFANFTSAFNYAADNEAVSKIEIGSDITETDYVELNEIRHDLSIVAAPGKNVNVKIPGALSDKGKGDDICVENKATLTLGEGVSIDQIDQFVPGYTGVGSLVVNGDITINRIQSWGNSTVTINKTGSVKLSGDDGYLYFVGEHAELNVYGNLTGTDDESLKNAKESLHIGYANMVDYWSCNNEIVFNFEDALVACTSGFASTAYSFKVNLDNSVFDMSCFTVNKGTTTFSLSNDAKVIASSLTVNADCSVNIVGDGGTVDVNGTLTNNGTITVDGYSTVVLKNYSGDGRLVVDLTGYTGRGGNIIVDAAAGMQWDGKYEVKAEENSKYSVEVDKKNGDLVLKKDESVIQLETVTTGEGDGQVSSNKLVFSDDGSVVQDASEKVGAENVDMVIDAADGEVTDTADIRADIVGKDVTITNNKDLLIEEGKKITATGNVNIENGSVVAKDGDPEAKLTGSVAAETIVMTNNGHADVDFTAKNMVIANNSVNTLTGTLGDGTTESIVIGAGTIKDGELLADKKSEGSIEDATISAKSIELSNQQVSDTTFAGFVLANGDVSFDGVNTFEKHELTKSKYHSVVKVTNGAVVTIGKDAVINGCNYFYIAAGNDSGYFGFADNSTGSGTIDIYGKVSATQINADASGTVNVKAGAEVDTEIICVEKGGISGATAGKMNIDGNVSAQNFNLFNGGKAVVNTGAVLEATRLNNERRYISVAYGSELDVNGGSVVIDTANASTGQSNSASAYLQLDGKMNVYNNGSVTVKKITTDEEGWKETAKNSYFAIGKDGLLSVTGGTVDVGTLKNAGTITVTAKSVGDTAAITAGSITGTGVITVDAKGFTGVKKVVDITGVGQEWADGQLVFKNLGKTKVVYGNDDGDVTLVNVDTSKLYVNSAWADYENNQAIAGSDDKLAFGINAFADFRKALAVANENKGGNIVLADEEYSWKALEKADEQCAVITNAGSYDITGGNGVLFNYEFEINPEKAAGNFVVKIHDAYFTCGKFTMRNNAIVTIDNSQIDSVYNKANNELYNDGTNYFSVYTNSVVTVNNSKICYTPEDPKFGAVYQVYGTATFNDSDVYAYVSSAPDAGFGVYGNGTVTLNASDLYCSFINVGVGITEKYLADGVDKTDLTATMTFNGSTVQNSAYQGDHNGNNSKIIVGSADGSTAGKLVITAGTDVDFQISDVTSTLEVRNADSSVEISGDSTLDIDKVSNAGTIVVSGSTLIADTVTNNGDFTVKGTSKLDIDKLSGNNVIVAAGTTLVNSNIGGGKVVAAGDSEIKDSTISGVATGNNTITLSGEVNVVADNVDVGGYTGEGDNKVWYDEAKLIVDGDVNTEASNGFYNKYQAEVVVNKGAVLTTSGKFQNNGDMTVYGKLNINNVEGDWLPKLAGTETVTSSLGGSFTVDGSKGEGFVSVDAGWLTFGGGQGSVWVEATGDYSVNIVNGGRLTTTAAGFRNTAKSTLNLNKGTLKFTSPATEEWPNGNNVVVNNAGIINASNASTVDFGDRELINDGSISIDSSDFKAGTVTNNGDFTVTGNTTINIDKLTTENKKYLVFEDVTLQKDSMIGGMAMSKGSFTLADNSSLKLNQINFYGKAVVKKGAVLNSPITTVADHLTIADGGALNVKYFNVDGVADVAGLVTVTNDNSKNYSALVRNGGKVKVSSTGSIVVNNCNGEVKAGGVLNINGGSVEVDKTTSNSNGGKFKNSGTTNLNKGSIDAEVAIENNGTFTATDATITTDTLTNNGIFTISGTSTVNAEVTGNAVQVASGAKITGSLTADLNLKGNITINGTFVGAVTGNKNITVSHSGSFALSGGEVNTITVTKSESDAYKKFVLSGDAKVNTIVFSSNANIFCGLVGPSQVEVGNIVIDGKVGLSGWLNTSNTANITGKNKAELTLNSASFFNGNKITGVKLNLTNVGTAADVDINADVALSDVKSINDNAVSSVDGVYFYNNADKTYILNKVDGGIDIVEATENKDLFEDEMGNFTLEGDLSDFDVTMKSGKTTLKVANGDSAAIGSIDKNDQGGVNNVSVGNDSGLTVGNIERMGNITVGKNGSDMTVTEKLTGTSAAETISIGNGSTFNSGNLDFASGKATFKLGKDAEAEIYGNYIVYGSSNSITLSAGAKKMVITGNIINYCGNNYDPVSGTVKYAPISGTTIKLGKGAEMTGKDIIGLAGLTLANGSAEKRNKKGVVTAKEVNTIFTAHNVYGTEKNNTINVGNYGEFTAADIDLFSGNDTFKIGNNSIVNLGALDFGAGKNTFKIGNDSIVDLGALDFGAGNDTFKIGKDSIVNLGALDFGAGKNTLTIGKNSKLTLDSVSGLGTFNATKGASVWFNDMEDVELDGIKGSWKNATIYDMKGDLEDTDTSDTEWIAEIGGRTYGNERDFYTFTGAANDKISVIGADSNNIVMLYKNENDSWNEVGMLSPLNTSTQLLENGQYAVAVYVVGADMNKNNNSLNDDNAYAFKIQLA